VRAVVFNEFKTFPVLMEVPTPTPGPGEVLLKVAGAGACHSDVSVYRLFDADSPVVLPPPFILGHETSGWIEDVGEGVSGFTKGDAYLVYGPTGCGHCRLCVQGKENYCLNAATNPSTAIGLGRDGGMAEYMVVPARNLVPLGDADPIAAASLADAALTPYHAIKSALPKLTGPGKFALVVGLGGLGQLGVQIIQALTGATVIATDMKEDALALAKKRGAITVPAGEGAAEAIRELTGGAGVDAAFDFVGATPTMELARGSVAVGGTCVIVGIGGGNIEWNFFNTSYEAPIYTTYWGSIDELHEVATLYRDGKITTDVERFTMDEALTAYERLEAGTLLGRAVVVPHA